MWQFPMKSSANRLLAPLMLLCLSLCLALAPLAIQAQSNDESVSVGEAYTLGAGDVVRIHVFGEPDLTFDAILIGESGKISYPFLGELTVMGQTLAGFEQQLLAGLKPDYLIDPTISVSIVEYRPFFISGEVKSPGSYPYQPGLRLRQAVSLAQGFSERASQSRIFVVHDNDPEARRHRVDLGYQVRPGDTITVEASFF